MLRTISRACCVAITPVAVGPAAAIAGERYVALGDSFSSGTGKRTYYDAACQKSVHA